MAWIPVCYIDIVVSFVPKSILMSVMMMINTNHVTDIQGELCV